MVVQVPKARTLAPVAAGAMGVHVERRVAVTGQAGVYEGLADGQRVALKLVPLPDVSEEDDGDVSAEDPSVTLRRAEREVAALRQHEHPAIIRLADVEPRALTIGDHRYFAYATEWHTGQSLKEVIASRRLTPCEVVALGQTGIEVISYLHERRVMHRDIKPANIMVGNGAYVFLDLGIADVFDEDSLTRTGIHVGTQKYMSPERLRDQEVDVRSEMFSLGVVMYEALMGQHPFCSTREEPDTNVNIVSGRLRRIDASAVQPELRGFVEIIERLLASRPSARFPAPEALASALGRVSEGLRC